MSRHPQFVDLAVGDPIVVARRPYAKGEPNLTNEVVTRIGRDYFYTRNPGFRFGPESQWHLADGRPKDSRGYAQRAHTPDGWEQEAARDAAVSALRQAGVTLSGDAARVMDADRLRRVLAVVQEVLPS